LTCEITVYFKSGMKEVKMLNMKKWLGIIMLGILVVGSFNFAGCKKEEKVIKIGAILPLTGNLAFLGKPEQVAIQIAQNEINKEGKIKVEIIFGDSKADPKTAVSIAHKMINIDKVDAIITSTSGVAMAVAPIAAKSNILNFAGCMATEVVKQGKTIFRLFVNAKAEAKLLTNYLANRYNKIGILVINSRGPLSEADAIKTSFEKEGKKVLVEETYELNQKDFTSLLTKLKGKDIDALLIIGYGFKFPTIFKTLKEIKFHKPIIGNVSFLMPVALEEGYSLYEGVKFASLPFTKDDPRFADFNKKYKEIAKSEPSTFADYVFFYDMVKIIAQAIKATGTTDGTKLAEYIIKKREFDGLSGKIIFDENGESLIPMKMAEFKGGKIVWVKE